MPTPEPEKRVKRPRLRLPFEKRKQDAGSWTYDHRIGLCVTLIAYLVLMIAFVSSKIVVGRKPHTQGMYIDLQTLAELEQERDRLERLARERQEKDPIDWRSIQNQVSNENALNEKLRDDRGTNAAALNDAAAAAKERMRANREAYELQQKANKVLMPTFFVLFVIIAIRVAFLPGSWEGYLYLLRPDWSYLLNPETWVMAMGQAFFSLSINGAGMLIYGSYMKKGENILRHAGMTAVLDTLAALLAGFAILPAVFAFGIDPTSGPQLMFVTLPQIFQQMPGGRIFALLFFVSVFFAGITSLMNMLEACGEALTSTFRLSRTVSTLLVGAAAFLPGLFLESLAGMGGWMDLITIYVSPFGALLVAVCIYFVLGMKGIRAELALGRARAPGRLFGITARFYVFLTVAVWILGIAYGGIG